MKQTIRGSWIRRWFLKQDDFTLWAIFIIFRSLYGQQLSRSLRLLRKPCF